MEIRAVAQAPVLILASILILICSLRAYDVVAHTLWPLQQRKSLTKVQKAVTNIINVEESESRFVEHINFSAKRFTHKLLASTVSS